MDNANWPTRRYAMVSDLHFPCSLPTARVLRLRNGSQVYQAHKPNVLGRMVEEYLPLVTHVSCSFPVLILLRWAHNIPFLRLRIVSPPIVKICTRVLYELSST